MKLKLIILGSGTTVPSLERSAPGYYLETPTQKFLVDCGSGTLVQLERSGNSYKDIDAVFVTHTHPDHIGDLTRLVQALKATPQFRRDKTLRLYGPSGFIDFYNACIGSLVSRPEDFSIELHEVKEVFNLNEVRVTAVATSHSSTRKSVAYRFEVKNKSIVFSGDCDYDSQIIAISNEADLLVLDCSFPDALKTGGHLSASECGMVAKQAKVKSLVLSHLYPVPRNQETRLDECRAIFPGDVRLAEDLMLIEV
ncbi:MAG: MBL fold metallo-hydrolase [Proteobacteria bacterium]|nr:MBL fold metallo-hydrolase [Pseudomonadota bacterium]